MALLWYDGCGEYYATTDIPRVWTSGGGGATVGSTGRRSGQAISCGQAAHTFFKGFNNGSGDRIIVGMAVKWPSLPSTTSIFHRVYGEGFNHLQFKVHNTGQISCELVSINNQVAITSGTPISADTWHYFEYDVTVGQTDGICILRVDGVELANQTSLDTRHFSASSDAIDALQWQSSASFTARFDDIYICDGTTAIRNGFLGDVQCDVVAADGDGTTSAFDTTFPSSPTTHYTKVDEATPNDETDYNETPTNGDVDLFDYAALPSISGGATVLGVKASILARKIDAGPCNIRAVARPVATNRNGTSQPLQVDYNYKHEIWAQNPETSADWTDALINASEFGVEKVA
jgi:hypothetical protein